MKRLFVTESRNVGWQRTTGVERGSRLSYVSGGAGLRVILLQWLILVIAEHFRYLAIAFHGLVLAVRVLGFGIVAVRIDFTIRILLCEIRIFCGVVADRLVAGLDLPVGILWLGVVSVTLTLTVA